MKYSQDQPPKILESWNILKPNLQKYWSIEIFSSPTSKNIEVLKYSQSQPPKILNYWNILKPNLQARQRRRRSFRRKLTLSWSLWNILIVIVLVAMKYFEHHFFSEFFSPVCTTLSVRYEQEGLVPHFFTWICVDD